MSDTFHEDDAEIRVVEAEPVVPVTATDSTVDRNEEHFRRAKPEAKAEAEPEQRRQPRDRSRVVEDDEDLGPRVQKRLNQFRRRTGDAEARATALAEENQRVTAQLHEANRTAFTHYEEATAARLANATREAQEAYESGDGQRIVEANRKLASAQFALDSVESTKRQRQTEEAQRPQPQSPATQPAAARPTFSARTQAWVDRNPWFTEDQDARAGALAVHNQLVRKGFTPESDEYFAELDKRCKSLVPDHYEDGDPDEDTDYYEDEPQQRRPAAEDRPPPQRRPPVAPASRERTTPQAPGTRRVQEIKLSRDQMEAAAIAGVSPKEYAMSMMNLRKGGAR